MGTMITVRKTVLDNHRQYTYEFTDKEEAEVKLTHFKRYKQLVKKKYPGSRFKLETITEDNKYIIIVEVWIYPQSLLN